MISTFGIHFAIAVQSVVSPAPTPEPVIIEAVVIVVEDTTGGHFESADITVEEAVNVQTAEDAVTCSYVSSGNPGTGEAGVTYTFQTGKAEAESLGLDCS